MELKGIEYELTVCKVADVSDIDMATEFYFTHRRTTALKKNA